MANKDKSFEKLSPALAARLSDLPAGAVIRVLLFLNIPTPTSSRRLSPAEREAALAEARTATTGLLEQLSPALAEAGARRVDAGGLNALGSVLVDVPARGVARLARADQVRMILEDQPLSCPEGARAGKRP